MTGFERKLSDSDRRDATGIWKQRSGEFPGADEWTDCRTHVAVDRKFLKKLEMNIEGFIKLGRLVLHELCHHEESNGSHTHDEYFYREFHDNPTGSLPWFVTDCIVTIPKTLEAHGRRETKKMLKLKDPVERVDQEPEKTVT